MEGRAHSRQTHSAEDETSRMQQDFDLFSKDLCASFQARPAFRGKRSASAIHVGVVGGGLAGLRCAEILLEKGVQVTLLEARDRLGGRVSQDVLLGNEVDLGPNWIHGTLNNPILNLAKETHTVLCTPSEDTLVYDEDGQILDKKRVEECHEVVWDIIAEAFRFSNQNTLEIPQERTLKDFFTERLAERDLSTTDRDLVMRMGEMWGSFVGESWDRQSLKYFWLEECLDGDNLYVANTHRGIISHVSRHAIQHAKIVYGERVTAVRSHIEEQYPKVTVETEGCKYYFDEVIITVPIGCLKQKHIGFSPSLPDSLERSLDNISYSRLEKAYITFPSAFWDHPQPGCATTKTDSTQEIPSAAGLPCFAHFLSPKYTHQNPNAWTLEGQSLSSPAFLADHASPTLLFSIFGPCAAHLTSLIRDLDRASLAYRDTITAFFEPYYARLPNYSPRRPECRPSAVLATTWLADDLAGNGTYTNFTVDGRADARLEDSFREVRAGLPERGVWIAGEHAAPFVGLGTLTGAYWSGEAVGMRVLAAHGLVGEPEVASEVMR